MFEAARHGGGGHWERVGRGGDWRGWQMAEDRGERGKTCSSHCSCDPPLLPPPSLLLSEPSSRAQSWDALWLSTLHPQQMVSMGK